MSMNVYLCTVLHIEQSNWDRFISKVGLIFIIFCMCTISILNIFSNATILTLAVAHVYVSKYSNKIGF